jgi:hypothetical protein
LLYIEFKNCGFVVTTYLERRWVGDDYLFGITKIFERLEG